MDIQKLLADFNVDFKTQGNKHCTVGWVNMHCPFCLGSQNYHLGITIDGSRAYCWRCGYKPLRKVLSRVLGVNETQVKDILSKYKGFKPSTANQDQKIIVRRKAHKLPTGTSKLTSRHKKYLSNRNFDPDYLEHEWSLLATGPVSYLDHSDYRFRILAPIIWDGQEVSFQARDITGKSNIKYKACPKEREVIHHKEILYCHSNIDWSRPVIIVEGITDVWRLGKQAAGTFGIEFTHYQAMKIIRRKKQTKDRNTIIMFDDDPQAKVQARKLKASLSESGLYCVIYDIEGDPADLSQDEADKLVEELT